MPGNKKASLHLDGFFHPGSWSIQGRLLNPCSCGIGIYPAQNPPGETQTPPKDGVWVLGDTPAWLGQVISLNTIIHTPRGGSAFPKNSRKPANKAWRKILLPVAHSLLISGDQGKKKPLEIQYATPEHQIPAEYSIYPWLSPRFAALPFQEVKLREAGNQEGAFPMGLGMKELWDHPNLDPSAAPSVSQKDFYDPKLDNSFFISIQ